MAKYDVTKTNLAIERLLETTSNPRHRFLLMAYHRHRNLEMAGRYEEIFAPGMMAPAPAYHFHAGGNNADLVGQEAVKNLYRVWAETNQSIFYTEHEQVAVADNFVASVTVMHQQVSGKSLTANKIMGYLPRRRSYRRRLAGPLRSGCTAGSRGQGIERRYAVVHWMGTKRSSPSRPQTVRRRASAASVR